MSKNDVFIEYRKNVNYPKGSLSPSVNYPEYLFESDLSDNNQVYDMVRNLLYRMEYDPEHYNTPEWNPMRQFIKPGDKVVIKPNWVMHFNGNENAGEHALDCLVTNPSCLRAICDYCLIALKGKGEIIIGDAPMQDCDLQDLLENFGYNKMLQFYQDRNQPVKFADFRRYQSIFDKNKVITDQIYMSGSAIEVDMGDLSIHEKRKGTRLYQVDNYDKDDTRAFHTDKKHIYSINKEVLEADVIINFCKPKSHRLAGFTAAMKNMVGIAYDKASLPHRVAGSIEEGGDAYPYKNSIKRKIDAILDKKIKYEKEHNIFMATVERYKYGALYIAEKKFGRDASIKGIWSGNDTIWRTVVDLNHIERYADKQGKLQKSQQRKILNLGDMIIAGDHNGPCQPDPKPMGALIASEDSVAMDLVVCKMIGFPEDKIPMVRAIMNGEATYLLGEDGLNPNVNTNESLESGFLRDMNFPIEWSYKPHDNWKSIVE